MKKMNNDENRKPRTAQGAKQARRLTGDKPTYKKPEGKPGDRFARKKADGKPGDRPAYKKPAGRPGDRPKWEKTDAKPAYKKPVSKPGDRPASGERSVKPAARVDCEVRAPRSDARLVALKALYDVYFANAFSNLVLDKQLKAARISEEDRRLATNVFYQCVENRSKLEYLLEPFVKQPPEQIVTCILHIAAAQIMFLDRVPDFAAVNEAVNQAKLYKREEAAGFVNVVLRNLIRAKESGTLHLPSRDDTQKYLEIEYSASPDAVKLLTEAYDYEEAEKILAYKPAERTETIRPNLLKSSDAELEAYLTAQNISWEKGRVPHAYLVKQAGALAETDAYRQGMYSIQGQSAMLAAFALEPKRGMNVLDACAAPGGKAALICELMQGSGRVYAWDLYEHRVEIMKQNGKRLGLDNLRCAVRDACQIKDDLTRALDAVIIDAPCSGLGVTADKPDIKYHLTEARLCELTQTQQKLLDVCCEYVRKGGRLVYSTCTLLPRENEERVRAFLLSHPEFRLDEDDSYLPDEFKPLCKGGMLRLTPHRDGAEGFFIARMLRVL